MDEPRDGLVAFTTLCIACDCARLPLFCAAMPLSLVSAGWRRRFTLVQ